MPDETETPSAPTPKPRPPRRKSPSTANPPWLKQIQNLSEEERATIDAQIPDNISDLQYCFAVLVRNKPVHLETVARDEVTQAGGIPEFIQTTYGGGTADDGTHHDYYVMMRKSGVYLKGVSFKTSVSGLMNPAVQEKCGLLKAADTPFATSPTFRRNPASSEIEDLKNQIQKLQAEQQFNALSAKLDSSLAGINARIEKALESRKPDTTENFLKIAEVLSNVVAPLLNRKDTLKETLLANLPTFIEMLQPGESADPIETLSRLYDLNDKIEKTKPKPPPPAPPIAQKADDSSIEKILETALTMFAQRGGAGRIGVPASSAPAPQPVASPAEAAEPFRQERAAPLTDACAARLRTLLQEQANPDVVVQELPKFFEYATAENQHADLIAGLYADPIAGFDAVLKMLHPSIPAEYAERIQSAFVSAYVHETPDADPDASRSEGGSAS